MITQLAHICLFSDDVAAMVDFYSQKLGLKIAFTLNADNGKPFGWYMQCGKMSFIEIFDQAGAVKQWGGSVETLSHDKRFRHLCFEVEQVELFREQLLKAGVIVSPVTVGMDNSKQAWIKDPDGNDIELMEYTQASFQLGNPRNAE
ncbi:MAG TPA: VOC family protein [Bacteroidota bacterium]|nr:VOC family protein [Bacteroidota bacterium]